MKKLSEFLGLLCMAVAMSAESNESTIPRSAGNHDTSPADVYLRLADMRCEACSRIARDLIEVGAIRNTIDAVRKLEDGDASYEFRLSLEAACNHCYRAAHYWEMNVLNRAARNEEINVWLASGDATPLLDYFQTQQANRHVSR